MSSVDRDSPDETNLAACWVRTHYPGQHVVVVFSPDEHRAWVEETEKTHMGSEGVLRVFWFIPFPTKDAAIEFCRAVPDSKPYCQAWSLGDLVSENT